jgi:SAM-dependent methyltransferase
VEHDISKLDGVEAVQVVVQNGGFDLLVCCSALFLLANPAESIGHWAQLLKPGGRMIVDVSTDDKTVQRLWLCDLREAVGLPFVFDENWVTDIQSLERLGVEAGLEIGKSWRTRS